MIKLDNAEIKMGNDYGTVTLVAMDDQPLRVVPCDEHGYPREVQVDTERHGAKLARRA